MIIVEGLFKSYGKTRALNNTNMHVYEGTIHGLIGPNGAGKSTTLKILSTLVRPDRGSVTIINIPLKNGNAIRKQIGVVPETPRLHEHMNAYEEIAMHAKLTGIPRSQVPQQVKSVIDQMDLGSVAHQKISRYSTGMKKRVALAAAMVADPPVLLLDEPMSGLDPVIRRQFKDIILGLEGKTVLVSDHDLYTVDELCQSVTILKEGRTLIEDDIETLRKKTGRMSIEIRPKDPEQIEELGEELRRIIGVTSVELNKGLVVVGVNDPEKIIPKVIRSASMNMEIIEAKQSHISLEEIFMKLSTGGGLI